MNWTTSTCYFDEKGKVMNKKRIENGEYVIHKKEEKYKKEDEFNMKKIINYHCKPNPQTQIKFGTTIA